MPSRGLQKRDTRSGMRRLRLRREAGNVFLHMLAREKEQGQDADFPRPSGHGPRYRGRKVGLRQAQEGGAYGDAGMPRLEEFGQPHHFLKCPWGPAAVPQEDQCLAKGLVRFQEEILYCVRTLPGKTSKSSMGTGNIAFRRRKGIE